MSIKAVLLDLDDCLIHEGFEPECPILCDEAMNVLNYLSLRRAQGVKIVLASHNLFAQKILDRLGITHYFDLVLAYHDLTDKASHLHKVVNLYDIKPSEAILWDDLIENIKSVRLQGAQGALVDYKKGITLDQVKAKFEY